MSGTSLDGIDAAVLETDGENIFQTGPTTSIPYPSSFRRSLRGMFGQTAPLDKKVEEELTLRHADAVYSIIKLAGLKISQLDVVGFHGQTIFHNPSEKSTCQIGNGELLADILGVCVVNDFRTTDVLKGGEGAPLAPVFHFALAKELEKPLAILNLGGVANVTWIGPNNHFIAFDTGPGNALIDDWIADHGRGNMDKGGRLAQKGKVNKKILGELMEDSYFNRKYPKSLDRDYFSLSPLRALSLEDGAATLTAFTAASVAESRKFFSALPMRWLVSGGGRLNNEILRALNNFLGVRAEPVEIVGWDGDGLEAQAFAFLAVRSILNLPLSYPETTGVRVESTGGQTHYPRGVSR